jgi:hypothetical protein
MQKVDGSSPFIRSEFKPFWHMCFGFMPLMCHKRTPSGAHALISSRSNVRCAGVYAELRRDDVDCCVQVRAEVPSYGTSPLGLG